MPRCLAFAFILLILSACATVSPDAGFSDVRRIAMNRQSLTVEWNGHTTDDHAVAAAVNKLLTHPLTADTAVQIALLNNRQLQATIEEIGIAQADLVQAGLLKNPVFNLDLRIPTLPPSKTYLDLGVGEDFLSIVLIPARRKLAETELHAASARVADEVFSLSARTKTAFYEFQAAQQTESLSADAAKAADAASETAHQIHAAGNTGDLDELNWQAQAVRAHLELADARLQLETARQRLNDLLGLWGDSTNWTISDPLPAPPDADDPLDHLAALAVRQRMDLAAARFDALMQARALGLAGTTQVLDGADIGANGEHETDGQWRIGPSIAVPVPLFDQGQAATARAQAMFHQSRDRYWALAVSIRAEVETDRAKMLAARARAIAYAHDLLPIQQKILDQTQLQYNGMLASVFQLLQARQAQTDAHRQYITALSDYWTSRAQLEQAVGGRLTPATTRPTSGEQP